MTTEKSTFLDRQRERLASARALGSALPRRPSSNTLILGTPAPPAAVAETNITSTIAPIIKTQNMLPSGDWFIAELDALASASTVLT